MSAAPESVHFLDLASLLADLRATTAPVAGRRQRVLWRESGRVVVLFALDAGATLPDHAAPGTVTIHGVDGAVEVAAAGAVHRLRAPQLVALSPGVRHSVTAIGAEPAAFLVQIAAATG